MHNQEVHLKILDNNEHMLTTTISDWDAGNFVFTNDTGDVKFDVTHLLNQNYILTN
jgi:hypothetical protein